MKYEAIEKATFLARPNRFIAIVELNGEKEICHVKNTGRCRELLVPGATVYVQRATNPERKTKYDLITVKKGDRLINMDSQAPNLAAGEYLPTLFPDGTVFRAETVFGTSRFDYYIETPTQKIFMEIKGVTLEENGIVRFPDAPTERGVKHIRELMECLRHGYESYILFVIQMRGVRYFAPNDDTHPAFGAALREAAGAGVHILARDCRVTPDEMTICDAVEIRFSETKEEVPS